MTAGLRSFVACGVVCTAMLAAAVPPVAAQGWLRAPVTFAEGRAAVGGELTATFGTEDAGYFNYTSYDTSALRRVRAGLAVSLSPSTHLTLVGEARAETNGHVAPYAYFVRVTPWPDRPVSIQAGRIPPVFGTFARRGYAQSNPLIGEPLVYQYLTSVRSDAFPGTTSDILRMRGRGWRASYPVGNPTPAAGRPLIAGTDWDTGVQGRVGARPAEVSVSWTLGSLSVPRTDRTAGRGQFAARVALRPWPGITAGVSGSRGSYVHADALQEVPGASAAGSQSAVGLDGEFERGRVVVRAEVVRNTWHAPLASAPSGRIALAVTGGYVEGRYRPFAGFHVALRVDRLAFENIPTGNGPRPWEADVFRVEAGGGYALARQIMVKGTYQYNQRDGGRVRRAHLGAVQALLWF